MKRGEITDGGRGCVMDKIQALPRVGRQRLLAFTSGYLNAYWGLLHGCYNRCRPGGGPEGEGAGC